MLVIIEIHLPCSKKSCIMRRRVQRYAVVVFARLWVENCCLGFNEQHGPARLHDGRYSDDYKEQIAAGIY